MFKVDNYLYGRLMSFELGRLNRNRCIRAAPYNKTSIPFFLPTHWLGQPTFPRTDNVFQEEVGAWGPVSIWLVR